MRISFALEILPRACGSDYNKIEYHNSDLAIFPMTRQMIYLDLRREDRNGSGRKAVLIKSFLKNL